MDKQELIKILAGLSMINDNLSFAKFLFTLLDPTHQQKGTDKFMTKTLYLQLQALADQDIVTSYGIKLDANDDIEIIYQKIFVILYLKFVLLDPCLATLMFDNYKLDITELKQQILLTLINGPSAGAEFSQFVEIADRLLATGLDINFTATTYTGTTTTPYDYAKLLRFNRIAEYLEEHGADHISIAIQ